MNMSRYSVGGMMAMVVLSAATVSRAADAQPAGGQVAQEKSNMQSIWVYVGTYTWPGTKSQGIYVQKLDLASGALTPAELAAETTHPTFIALHPNGKFLYAANEMGDFRKQKSGAVSAFAIDAATGKLTLLNQQPSGGPGCCFVSVDGGGKNALVANYGGGSAAVLPIGEDGRLAEPSAIVKHEGKGPNAKRQEAPHAHSVKTDPTGRFALVADLGIDKLMIYRFDAAKGTLVPNDPPAAVLAPGSGPRHFAFSADQRFVYVISELANTVTAYSYDGARGALSEIQTITTLPEGFSRESTTAEVVIHPSGKFLYGSNRGHDSIAIFAVDQATGKLKSLGQVPSGGKNPRNFNIDPSGQWLLCANQNSNNIVVFRIDAGTGALKATGTPAAVPQAVCVKFLAAK
jgi:6-phosphogluconolactonase